MNPVLLAVRDLSVTLPGRATPLVDRIGFDLDAGQCLAVVGASGSGKTLSSTALLGLLPPGARCSGSIRYADSEYVGATPAQWRDLRRGGLAMVWQDALACLHPLATIGAQLSEALRVAGSTTRPHARRAAVDLLGEVGIERAASRLTDYPHQLSGGQRQRVMIALALAASPRVLIADEATSALDTTVQAQVIALLDRLRRDRGLALLLISHDLLLARDVADRVVVMDRGRIVEEAASAHFFYRATHPASRLLLDAGRIEHALRPEPESPELLRVDGLEASFAERGAWLRAARRTALRDVGLGLAPGRTLALVGQSGSGKSTLARCLLGLHRADRGTLTLGALRIDLSSRATRDWSAVRRQLQMVFQNPFASLDPQMRVEACIAESLQLHAPGLDRRERRARVDALLTSVGLDSALAARYPDALSGGQRQRVAIARALAVRPRCLILDEATSALDAAVQQQILGLLAQLQRDHGLALLFITHDLALAAAYADRVAVLWRGAIVESGPSNQLFAQPGHPHTQALLAARPGQARGPAS